MMKYPFVVFCALFLCQCTLSDPPQGGIKGVPENYQALEQFFLDWQATLEPPLIDGLPDYRKATVQKQYRDLSQWKKRLEAMEIGDWPIGQQVDWYVVWSDMNAMIFAHRAKKPWERDPAFYLWYVNTYNQPDAYLSPTVKGSIIQDKPLREWTEQEIADITSRLASAEALWAQARVNLTGDARDLWLLGEKRIRQQTQELEDLAQQATNIYPDLAKAAFDAAQASNAFADWLLAEADKKQGPSGVGELEYTWNLRNVHLLPFSWKEEKLLVEREIAHALSNLRLEQDRNRDATGNTPDDQTAAANTRYRDFLNYLEQKGIRITPESDTANANASEMQLGHWRTILAQVSQRTAQNSALSTIREAHDKSTIYDARVPTGMEEFLLYAALEHKSPQSREQAWTFIAQRAARAYGALHQHGLRMNHEQATALSAKWMPQEPSGSDLADLEHRYLQQAGLGTSYVIGRLEIERLLAVYTQKQEGEFSLSEFVRAFDQSGRIPLSLIYWEMTGDQSMLNAALEK